MIFMAVVMVIVIVIRIIIGDNDIAFQLTNKTSLPWWLDFYCTNDSSYSFQSDRSL